MYVLGGVCRCLFGVADSVSKGCAPLVQTGRGRMTGVHLGVGEGAGGCMLVVISFSYFLSLLRLGVGGF